MASLKEKATKSKSKLASKAKAKTETSVQPATTSAKDEVAPPKPQTNIAMPTFNAAPPLPPALAFFNYIATVPGLRKRERGI